MSSFVIFMNASWNLGISTQYFNRTRTNSFHNRLAVVGEPLVAWHWVRFGRGQAFVVVVVVAVEVVVVGAVGLVGLVGVVGVVVHRRVGSAIRWHCVDARD
jgi:hypothetical protein